MKILDRMTARLKGWRTRIVNFLLLLAPILTMSELAAVIPEDWYAWYALAVALINMVLREITTTPAGKNY